MRSRRRTTTRRAELRGGCAGWAWTHESDTSSASKMVSTRACLHVRVEVGRALYARQSSERASDSKGPRNGARRLPMRCTYHEVPSAPGARPDAAPRRQALGRFYPALILEYPFACLTNWLECER